MTKDGRPSRIIDIRYFIRDVNHYLPGQDDAVAFGRRTAWFLNGEGFSLGAYPALYVVLDPILGRGAVRVADHGGEWWLRYAHVGVPSDFQDRRDASEIVMNATVRVLKTIRPDLAAMIEHAEQVVRVHGDDLRFLLKTRQIKRFIVDISCNIPIGRQPAYLFTSLTDLTSGEFREAPPLSIGFYGSAFEYNGPIRATEIERTLSEFVPSTRPLFSKMVKRRG